MVDPWATAFGALGPDFEALMAPLLAPVTVSQIDPDTGAATATDTVAALDRTRLREAFAAGGGELGDDTSRFVFRSELLPWTPKARDQIAEADGTVWVATAVNFLGFSQLTAVDAVIKR